MMKRFFYIFTLVIVACCMLNAQTPGESCLDAVAVKYGDDLHLNGEQYWIKLKFSDFKQDGLTAFWYSSDSLLLELYLKTGFITQNCVDLNVPTVVAPNTKIIVGADNIEAYVDSALKVSTLSESDKRMVTTSMVYIGLTPIARQKGRFIFNQYGLGAASDCATPWDVVCNAHYVLNEGDNILRVDPSQINPEAQGLNVTYVPMDKSVEDLTQMQVQIRLGSCNADVAQSAKSVANIDGGVVGIDPDLINKALAQQLPIYISAQRGKDFATVTVRNIYSDTIIISDTICQGATYSAGGQTYSEQGEYTFQSYSLTNDGVVYNTNHLNLYVDNSCQAALGKNEIDAVVSPTIVAVNEPVAIFTGEQTSVQVYDLAGRCVRNEECNGSISIAFGTSGEYIVRLISRSGSSIRKLLVR